MPDLDRRRLLALPAAIGGGAVAATLLGHAFADGLPPLPDLGTWEAVRAQFRLDPAYAHFASFYIASHPAPVRDAIEHYRRMVDRNPYRSVEEAMFEAPEHNLPMRVQAAAADYLGGQAEDVCLTRCTTEGLALVYQGFPLEPGDEVVTTTHDHYSHHESIRLATERAGATMRKIRLFEDAARVTTDGLVARLLAGIGPRTRVVGLTWVHSSSGIRLPIREMAAALKAHHPDVRLVLDGVHGFGAVDETIATLGVDYFCAGTHKWMFAPRGTGLVWAPAARWAQLRPTVPNFTELESYNAWTEDRAPATPNNAARMSPGGFHAFEHQWAMAAAFAMHARMGRARVAQRIASLNSRLKTTLATHPKVRLHTPHDPALSAGLVAFEVAGVATNDVVKRLLERRIIASASPYAVSYPRLAASLVNTEAEVDRAVRAVHAIAG